MVNVTVPQAPEYTSALHIQSQDSDFFSEYYGEDQWKVIQDWETRLLLCCIDIKS